MSYNTSDLERFAALLSNANLGNLGTTSPNASKPEARRDKSTHSHLQRLETRIESIESMLSKILEHIGLSKEETQAGISPSKPPNTSNSQSDIDTTNPKTTSSKPYTYTPLSPQKTQLRILRLHHSSSLSTPLIASLETVGLDDQSIKNLMYGFSRPIIYVGTSCL
jgi:hypothetical protein